MKKILVILSSLVKIKGVLYCNERQMYKNDQFLCSQNRSAAALFSSLQVTSQLNQRGFIPALVLVDISEIKVDKRIE